MRVLSREIRPPHIPFNPNKPSTRFVFDLQTDNNPRADGNSLAIGVEYGNYIRLPQKTDDAAVNRCLQDGADEFCAERLRRRSGQKVTHFDWSISGKLESDRRFRNTNLIGSGRFSMPIYMHNSGSRVWTFDPFVGIDLGRNVHSPVADAESRGIARPFAGVTT